MVLVLLCQVYTAALEEIQQLAGLRAGDDLLNTTTLMQPELLRRVGEMIVRQSNAQGACTQETIEVCHSQLAPLLRKTASGI